MPAAMNWQLVALSVCPRQPVSSVTDSSHSSCYRRTLLVRPMTPSRRLIVSTSLTQPRSVHQEKHRHLPSVTLSLSLSLSPSLASPRPPRSSVPSRPVPSRPFSSGSETASDRVTFAGDDASPIGMTLSAHSDPRRRFCKVRQACDSCRARKIRCDGARPCANCLDVSFECTYLAVPKKTGPKGRRKTRPADPRTASYFSTVLPSAVRASTGGCSPTESPDSSHHVPRQIPSPPPPWGDVADASTASDAGDFVPSPRVTKDIMASCLDAFFTHKYPITPILDRNQVESALFDLQHRPEMYGLITACCAVMVLSPDMIVPGDKDATPSPEKQQQPVSSRQDDASRFVGDQLPSDTPTAEFFLSETVRARGFCDWAERPSLTTIQTSFFLFSALFCLGKDTSAWHYIREATTALQSLRLHEESTYSEMRDPVQARYARRMFWVLFITERAYALQRHRSLALHGAIALPSSGQDLGEEKIMSGLLDLILLFRNFDSDFLTMWNTTNDSHVSVSTKDYPAKLQRFLEQSIPQVAQRTANQQADLILSREWLRIVVWQLCVAKTLLCSSSPLESMSFQFPVSVARNVVVATSLLPGEALGANGVGILEKIFDVGCSLADVLSVNPHCVPRTALEMSPADYLREMVRLVGTAVGGSPRHWRVLAAKADECLRSGTLYIMATERPDSRRNPSVSLTEDEDGDERSTEEAQHGGQQDVVEHRTVQHCGQQESCFCNSHKPGAMT